MDLKLNAEQKLAANHGSGPCIVTATPGSGKTLALTTRVATLIRSGVDPLNILAVTFTNKAAEEMRSRVAKLVGQHADKVWISTFHSLCLAIIRKYGNLNDISSNFTIYDDKDQKELLSKVARMHEYDDCGKNEIFRMQRLVNNFRENLEDIESALGEIRPIEVAVIKEYLDLLREFNALDFSDILYQAWRLCTQHQIVTDKLSNKFKYVLEDEGQDANRIQYEILKAIAPPPNGNLFVVADVQQAIFKFRGARPENLDEIQKEYQDVKTIILLRNYRSTAQILKCAQSLIRHNPNAEDVELISVRGDGRDVFVTSCRDPEHEAETVVRRIKHLRAAHGYEWNDFAVLYRMNRLSKTPEMVLRRENIPYRIVGGFSFFDRSEVKTALAYWSFFANPNDTISFSRAISNPKRGVGEVIIGRLERFCQNEKVSMLEACGRLDEVEGISAKARKSLIDFVATIQKYQNNQGRDIGILAADLLRETGYYDYMEKESQDDPGHKRRIDNIDELLMGVSDYTEQKPGAKMEDYLQSTRLFTTEDQLNGDQAVTLLTMHSSKGKEWPSVHIIGAEEGVVPHSLSVRDGDIGEERRILYVSISRAASNLSITYSESRKRFNKYKRTHSFYSVQPSRFLSEAGLV